MSTEGVTGENKSKQRKKKQDIIILETIKEIKDRKKVKANSGEKSTFCTYTLHLHLHFFTLHVLRSQEKNRSCKERDERDR